MTAKMELDPLAGLDPEQIGRELDEALSGLTPSVEEIMADLQKPGYVERMNRRHAALGRMLQRVGLEFFRSKATRKRGTCA